MSMRWRLDMVGLDFNESKVNKVELLAMLLDILNGTERDAITPEAEYEFLHAIDLTADALSYYAETKRLALEGLPCELPADILDRHTRILRLRAKSTVRRV